MKRRSHRRPNPGEGPLGLSGGTWALTAAVFGGIALWQRYRNAQLRQANQALMVQQTQMLLSQQSATNATAGTGNTVTVTPAMNGQTIQVNQGDTVQVVVPGATGIDPNQVPYWNVSQGTSGILGAAGTPSLSGSQVTYPMTASQAGTTTLTATPTTSPQGATQAQQQQLQQANLGQAFTVTIQVNASTAQATGATGDTGSSGTTGATV